MARASSRDADEETPIQRKESKRPEEEQKAQRKEKRPEDEKKVQRKEKRPEEDKRAQRKEKRPDEEKKVQRKEKRPDEEKKAQRKERRPEDEKKVQRDANTPASPSLDDVATRAVQNKGSGQPLQPQTRNRLESSMGVDLSRVRVHDDASSRATAQEMNARAFTHQNDIWLGPGESQNDTRLMAHEATHVVQQQSGMVQRAVQRLANYASTEAGFVLEPNATPKPKIRVPRLYVPAFKKEKFPSIMSSTEARRLFRAANYRRGNPNQVGVWEAAVPAAPLATKLKGAPLSMRPHNSYLIRSPGTPEMFHRMGTPDDIAEGLKRPFWNAQGNFLSHQVDHIAELQMSGWPRAEGAWANQIDNMWMLNSRANEGSGTQIHDSIEAAVEAFKNSPAGAPVANRTVEQLKTSHDIVFAAIYGDTSMAPRGGSDTGWKLDEVQAGEFLDIFDNEPATRNVKVYDLTDPHPQNTKYSPQPAGMRDIVGSGHNMKVYLKQFGGTALDFRWDTRSIERPRLPGDPRIHGFAYEAIGFNHREDQAGDENVGWLRGRMYTAQRNGMLRWESGGHFTWNVKRMRGLRFAGYLDPAEAKQSIEEANPDIEPLSPIAFDSVDIDDNKLTTRGRILPTIPLFENIGIDLVLEGDDLRAEKAFQLGEFSVPSPFSIDDITLVLSIGTASGLRVTGRVDFGIEGLGRGYLGAALGTAEGFALDGEFNFDSETFQPARVRLSYREGRLTGEGELGIGPGKIRGVSRATLRALYEEGRIEAHGTADFDVRGIERATMDLVHSDAETTIDGTLTLGRVPGIRSGSLQGRIAKTSADPDWHLSASGTAVPDIPGIESTLTLSYDDGAFSAEFGGSFRRGMLSGTANVGVTNRTLDAAGEPTGDPSTDGTLIVFGGGSVTLRITPWLEGTAGIRFAPNGEVTISGEIGLPGSVEIFARRQIERSLLNIAVQVPIIPGIVAEIGGGLNVQAGIGPGVIDQLRIGITYNPAHEEDTHITGDAHLNIPADAGLRLAVRAGIGLGITGASATGGLEIGGMLGIAGAAQAGVHIDWTPRTGLRIDAFGELSAEPAFRFDISGYVSVRVLGFSVYDHRWELAAFQFGSNLRFGARFPIHYIEGQPFDISLSDVEFIVPDVNPREILSGLIDRIA